MTAARQPEFERRLLLGERIIFAAIAEQAAVHFWVVPDWKDEGNSRGGLEFHQRPQAGQEPTYDWCFVLNAPCCHDGSALYAEEKLIPLFHFYCETGDGNYEPIWQEVESALRRLISEREADTGGD